MKKNQTPWLTNPAKPKSDYRQTNSNETVIIAHKKYKSRDEIACLFAWET